MRKLVAILVLLVCCLAASGREVAVMVRADDASLLTAAGVRVTAQVGDVLTAVLPEELLPRLCRLPSVHRVNRAHLLTLCNDSVRSQSRVASLHDGELPCRGRGVIVGMVDVGVDFNHINLCDENGRSRVRAAYLPCDETGPSPVVDGMELPGSCYETPEQIASLTTDVEGMSHGTHTTGTAAGSYTANHWHGMAPEADLVICAMPGNQLTDVNIANGLRYIMDYAQRHNQPCVINMSLSDNVGPHDGTSNMCQAMESLVGPGRIIVVSAGNDGNKPTHVSRHLASRTDSLRVLLQENSTSLTRYGNMSVWNTDASHGSHSMRVVVVDRQSGAVLYRGDCIEHLPADSVYTLTSDADPEWAKYFTGTVWMATEVGENGKYHSYSEFDVEATASRYLFGLVYGGEAGTMLEGWCYPRLQITSSGLAEYADGDSDCSISDLATTDAVISVGAYCSRDRFRRKDGKWETYKDSPLGDIAPFSSYGPDLNGVMRPDVTAPGLMVISSASRYDSYLMGSLQHRPPAVEWGGVTYPYAMNYGTSMSAPAVTGAVALWLEANPRLTPAEVRKTLMLSSYWDHWVAEGDRRRWGSGKLDALAGWRQVRATGVTPPSADATVVSVTYCDLTGRMSATPMRGMNLVLIRYSDGTLIVNRQINNE
ncbi:MAG: S8 family serine peptidase [Muribaculaceae bacterium]|nr:S8 family serine peptidase [Muribaculaceae bacterium]